MLAIARVHAEPKPADCVAFSLETTPMATDPWLTGCKPLVGAQNVELGYLEPCSPARIDRMFFATPIAPLDPDALLDAVQVAEIIGMKKGYVWKLARDDQIPHVRFGMRMRFRRQAILAWVEQREQGD